MGRAHVSAWNTRCTEERKTGKVPIKDTQNHSVPMFPFADIVLKGGAGKSMLIDMATQWESTFLMLERLLELTSVVKI